MSDPVPAGPGGPGPGGAADAGRANVPIGMEGERPLEPPLHWLPPLQPLGGDELPGTGQFGPPEQPLPRLAEPPPGRLRLIAPAAVALLLLSSPLWVGDRGTALVAELAVVVGLAQWWATLARLTGVVSTTGAFHAGLGASVWVALVEGPGLHPAVALVVTAVACGVAAAPIGWVLLRLPTVWAALVGLVLAAAGASVVALLDDGSARDRTVRAVIELGPLARRGLALWPALVLAVGSVALTVALRRGRLGLTALAARDDPEVAATLGLRPVGPVLAMGTAAAVVAVVAGVVPPVVSGTVQLATAFDPVFWVLIPVVAALLGGTGSSTGPVLGAVVVVLARQALGTTAALALCAAAALVLSAVLPAGLGGLVDNAVGGRAAQWWAAPGRARPGQDGTGIQHSDR